MSHNMSHKKTGAASVWLSYHVFLPGDVDIFLTQYLRPLINAQLRQHTIRRFFFIRYGEGGPHLRIRYFPAPGIQAECVRSGLSETVSRFTEKVHPDDPHCRIEQRAYDRTDHYFGETLQSVYAELLNECTSKLALLLLATPFQTRQTRVCLTGCFIWLFGERMARAAGDCVKLWAESEDFAIRALAQEGLQLTPLTPPEDMTLRKNLCRIMLRLAVEARHRSSTRKFVHLLRRARSLPNGGSFVGIHALHLFSNKMGLTLAEEGYIYHALGGLAITGRDI